jgi:hypothetical protein
MEWPDARLLLPPCEISFLITASTAASAKKRKALLCRSNKSCSGESSTGREHECYDSPHRALLAKWIFPRLIFKDNWAARNEIKASVFAAAGALERD